MGWQEVGDDSKEGASAICFGTLRGKARAGQAGVGAVIGSSCFDVSIDLLVLGEAGLVW